MAKHDLPGPPPWNAAARLPSIDALRAFEAAVRLGSFERAAAELAVTASAVGKRIQTLEGLLGTQLLTRLGRGVRPTVAGLDYLEDVRGALQLLSSLPLHQRRRPQRTPLRICAPPTFARQILIPHLADFQQAHPRVEPELTLSVPYLGLSPPGADVYVRAVPRERAEPRSVILDEPLQPVCAPNYAARLGPFSAATDLERATLLRSPLEPWRPWLMAAGLDWPEPAGGPLLVDLGLTLTAAAHGLGVALARRSLATEWLHRGELVTLFTWRSASTFVYTLETAPSESAAGFGDWLRALCQELVEQPEP